MIKFQNLKDKVLKTAVFQSPRSRRAVLPRPAESAERLGLCHESINSRTLGRCIDHKTVFFKPVKEIAISLFDSSKFRLASQDERGFEAGAPASWTGRLLCCLLALSNGQDSIVRRRRRWHPEICQDRQKTCILVRCHYALPADRSRAVLRPTSRCQNF